MAKKTYRDPYDPKGLTAQDTPSQHALRQARQGVDDPNSFWRTGDGKDDPAARVDRLQTQVDKEKFDRAQALRASQSGFAQHLGTPPKGKATQRSSNDPMQDDFNRVRQVGDAGNKFTG